MEELVKIFGKYFPKDFRNLEISKKELYIKNENLSIDFEENKLNFTKIYANGSAKINLDLSKLKNSLIYIYFILSENSNLFINVKGKIENRVCFAIEVLGNKNSKVEIFEKIVVLGEHINISRINIPKGSLNSELLLDQSFLLFKDGKIINLPILNVEEKKCKAKHYSKKVKLNEEQFFYLETKNLSREKVISLLEKSFLET